MADKIFYVSGNWPNCEKFIGFEASIDHECYDESLKEPPTESFGIDRVVQLLNSHFSKVEEGFSRIDARFNLLEERVKIIDAQSTGYVKHGIDVRSDLMEKRPHKELGMIQKQFTTIDEHFVRLNKRFDVIQENVEAFKVGTDARFDVMEEHAKVIQESLNFDDDFTTFDAHLNKRFDAIQENVEAFRVETDARFDVMGEHAKAIQKSLNVDDDDFTIIHAHIDRLNKRFDVIQENVEAFKVRTDVRFDVMEEHAKAIQESLEDDDEDDGFASEDTKLEKMCEELEKIAMLEKLGVVNKKVDSVVANLNVMLSRIEVVNEKLNVCCEAKNGDECCSLRRRRDRHTDDGFLAELDKCLWWKGNEEGLDAVPEDIRDANSGIVQSDIGSDDLLEGTQSQDAPWVVI